MKSLLNIRYIYKIPSSKLAQANWDLSLTRQEATQNNELIGLASSTATRMIDTMNGNENIDRRISSLKREIKKLKKAKNKSEDEAILLRTKIHELSRITLISDILFVVMESKKDYDRCCKGFKVNGVEYVRLIATSGGVKKSTVIFVNKELHHDLYKWFNNDRDLTKQFVPAKLEAYISLVFSASIPVSSPKGIVVVHDVETTFKDNVILVDGNGRTRPKVETIYDYETTLNACDGMGLMMPHLAYQWSQEVEEDFMTSGVCVRNAFLKGMVYSFDFQQFAKEVAQTNTIVDVWGHSHNINDIDIVLTTSMLKLWDSYTSIEHYLSCCEKNHYEFAITKIIDEHLDNEQTMNYQFLQSLKLSDEDIYNLCKPTIDEFNDILSNDHRKTLLFLRGHKMNVENVMGNLNDFTSGLMVDSELLQDKYVYSKVRNSIKYKIDDAKLGVIKVKGNFSLVSGDPYILCQSMFGLETTGLLKRGEFYSHYWASRGVDKVVGMRAPMSVHNNIVVRKIVATPEMQKWYQYMPCVTIFNSWDNTCSALNGCDMDGDTIFTTNNPYVLKGVDETVMPIVCVQSSCAKKIPTEKDFITSNKSSFGSDIGTITNYATAFYNIIANYEEGSPEWIELDYRIKCMQDFQQNSIDAAKGVVARPVPKEWYDYKVNKIEEGDSEEVKRQKLFNLSIMANKKPYFFIYNYAQSKTDFLKFHKSAEDICVMKYGKLIQDLLESDNLNQMEQEFLTSYINKAPVNMTNCTMNKIARIFEREFDTSCRHRTKGYNKDNFKTTKPYSVEDYQTIANLKKQHDHDVALLIKKQKYNRANSISSMVGDNIVSRDVFTNMYCDLVYATGIDEEDICNIVVDMCYTSDNSKRFAWQIVGERMIKNLIANTSNKVSFPIQDDNGDIEYCGKRFRMLEVGKNENSL